MKTLEEIYEEDPTQRIIAEGAGFAAEQSLKDGYPITYRDEEYPEYTVKEYPDGRRFLMGLEFINNETGIPIDAKTITVREISSVQK